MSTVSEAKFVGIQQKLDRSIEELGEYIERVRDEVSPRDLTTLVQLYTNLLTQERRFALSQMYLSEPLAVASERLLENPDDSYAATEVTSLLKAI